MKSVVDLRHFLDMPEGMPGPARRMAEQLSMIVSAATSVNSGERWVSPITCKRRPGRKPCTGNLILRRTDIPPVIEWQCIICGDNGVITGWERTPPDQRRRGRGAET